MRKNRIIYCMVLLIVLTTLMSVLTGCTTAKIPIPTVEKDVYIYDEADIIDDDVEKELNKMLVELEKKTEAEFAVVSIESLLDISIEEYAYNLFNAMDIGKKGKGNGGLLLFSKSDKKVKFELGHRLEICLNDSKCDRILDKYFVPYSENDEYTKATEMTVQAALNAIAEKYRIDIQGLEKDLAVEDDSDKRLQISPKWMIVLVVLVVLALIAYARFQLSRMKKAYQKDITMEDLHMFFEGGEPEDKEVFLVVVHRNNKTFRR